MQNTISSSSFRNEGGRESTQKGWVSFILSSTILHIWVNQVSYSLFCWIQLAKEVRVVFLCRNFIFLEEGAVLTFAFLEIDARFSQASIIFQKSWLLYLSKAQLFCQRDSTSAGSYLMWQMPSLLKMSLTSLYLLIFQRSHSILLADLIFFMVSSVVLWYDLATTYTIRRSNFEFLLSSYSSVLILALILRSFSCFSLSFPLFSLSLDISLWAEAQQWLNQSTTWAITSSYLFLQMTRTLQQCSRLQSSLSILSKRDETMVLSLLRALMESNFLARSQDEVLVFYRFFYSSLSLSERTEMYYAS